MTRNQDIDHSPAGRFCPPQHGPPLKSLRQYHPHLHLTQIQTGTSGHCPQELRCPPRLRASASCAPRTVHRDRAGTNDCLQLAVKGSHVAMASAILSLQLPSNLPRTRYLLTYLITYTCLDQSAGRWNQIQYVPFATCTVLCHGSIKNRTQCGPLFG